MAAVGDLQPHTVRSFRAKPTEARPRHSLFGTALENVDKSELEGIDASEAHKIGVKHQPQRYPIPEHLQGHVSARAIVDKAHQGISSQNRAFSDTQKQLKEKQQKALMFRPDSERKQRGKSRELQWLTKQDLDHSKDINTVGLSYSGSFNHEKYGNKPPTHNYSLVGDVLSKGNEFGHPQKYDPDEALLAQNKSQNNNLGAIRLGWNPKVAPDKEIPLKPKPQIGIELPPNIRHQYGSRVCDYLLADPEKVAESLERQKVRERTPLAPPGLDIKEYQAKATGNYFDVGHMTRYNIFPGHTMLDMNSTLKADHNDVVYLRREPMTNKYRVIKDGYVCWREQFLLRKRMEEQWDAFFKSQPQFSASWDRSQTRSVREPKPQAAAPKPKSRPRPKPKPKAKTAEKEPLFEDVVFKTPPMTPPPKPPSPAKFPEKVERDDEFWAFYDKK